MNNQDLFEKYLMTREEVKQIQTPVSASIDVLVPKKMLGTSEISEEEFDKMFEDILKTKNKMKNNEQLNKIFDYEADKLNWEESNWPDELKEQEYNNVSDRILSDIEIKDAFDKMFNDIN
jgi:hypothetical protein